MTIDLVDDERSLASLAAEWNELLERSLSNTLFLTYAWVTTWWSVFGLDHRLFVLVARVGKDLVGVVPFTVGILGRWHLQSLEPDLLGPRSIVLGSIL
jgi:hypothetical protein